MDVSLYYESEEDSNKIPQGYNTRNPLNFDIFEPCPETFPLDSLSDLLESNVEKDNQTYKEYPNSTPQCWYIRDQRNWIDAGRTHILYNKHWWKEFTTYDGIYVDFWGSYYYLLPDRDTWSDTSSWSQLTAIYSPKDN